VICEIHREAAFIAFITFLHRPLLLPMLLEIDNRQRKWNGNKAWEMLFDEKLIATRAENSISQKCTFIKVYLPFVLHPGIGTEQQQHV